MIYNCQYAVANMWQPGQETNFKQTFNNVFASWSFVIVKQRFRNKEDLKWELSSVVLYFSRRKLGQLGFSV